MSDALVVTARRSPVSGIHSFGNLPGLWSYSHRLLPPGGHGTWPAVTPVLDAIASGTLCTGFLTMLN